MRSSATTVFVFSLYMYLLGLVLVFAPNTLFRLLRIAVTQEVWIRVVGVLALVLAFYYSNAARRNLREFFRWTVGARASVLPFLIAFVVVGIAPPILILFGLVEFASAGWTAYALRAESRPQAN